MKARLLVKGEKGGIFDEEWECPDREGKEEIKEILKLALINGGGGLLNHGREVGYVWVKVFADFALQNKWERRRAFPSFHSPH